MVLHPDLIVIINRFILCFTCGRITERQRASREIGLHWAESGLEDLLFSDADPHFVVETKCVTPPALERALRWGRIYLTRPSHQ